MEVFAEVVGVFEAHVDADEIIRDAGGLLFFFAGMQEDRGCGVQHEGAGVADVGDVERVAQAVDEGEGPFFGVEAQGEHGTEAAAKLFVGDGVIRA